MAILVDIPVGQDFENLEAVSINVIDVIAVQGYREIVVVNDQSKSTE